MANRSTRADKISAPAGSVEFDADVLVLGGGPAGTWAAVSAAEQGACVVLADKGFVARPAPRPPLEQASGMSIRICRFARLR